MTAPGCSSQNMLVSRASCLRCRCGVQNADPTKGHPNQQSIYSPMVHAFMHCHREHKLGAVRKNFPGNSENTNRKTRLSKCRTLSIMEHAFFWDNSCCTLIPKLPNSRITALLLGQIVFVNAPIAVLNAQTFVESQSKDSREHAHTHHLWCHGRPNFQRNRNFTDRHPSVLFFLR